MTRTETNRTRRTSESTPRRPPGSAYWLIAKNEKGRMEVLTLDRDGEQTLPVFGHEEEAEMFLWLGDAGGDWRVRESSAGELASVLCGPRKDVGRVALDPLPKMLAETVELAGLSRERFLGRILERRRLPAP